MPVKAVCVLRGEKASGSIAFLQEVSSNSDFWKLYICFVCNSSSLLLCNAENLRHRASLITENSGVKTKPALLHFLRTTGIYKPANLFSIVQIFIAPTPISCYPEVGGWRGRITENC